MFFVVFSSTIAATRVFMWMRPTHSPTIKGLRLHHYMYGLVAVPVSIVVDSLTLYAVGVGLIIDELTWLMRGGKYEIKHYMNGVSLTGNAVFALAVFFFRDYFIAVYPW